jgi:hypothetical protein
MGAHRTAQRTSWQRRVPRALVHRGKPHGWALVRLLRQSDTRRMELGVSSLSSRGTTGRVWLPSSRATTVPRPRGSGSHHVIPHDNAMLPGAQEGPVERPKVPVWDATRLLGLTSRRERAAGMGQLQVRPAPSRSRYCGGTTGGQPGTAHGASTGRRREVGSHTDRSDCRNSLTCGGV